MHKRLTALCPNAEMELKKLHLGTMSYGVDSMDEVAHQLATALGEEKAVGAPS